MSTYPNLTDGQPLRQTTKRTVSMNTTVHRFLDGSEQRYVGRTPVQLIDGTYPSIFASDYATIEAFHDAMQGRFGQHSLTFDGHTYTNMYFDSDAATFTEGSVNKYSCQVKLKGFPGAAFPTITVSDPNLPTLDSGTGGPLTQWPSQLFHRQYNSIVDLDDTARFAFHYLSSPIAGLVLQMPMITTAEAAIFEAFFIQMAGRYGIFTVTYNGVAMVNCRFDSDTLELDFSKSPGVCSITLPLVAIPT